MQNIKLDKKEIISLVIYGICLVEIFFIIPVQVKNFSSLHHKMSVLKKKVIQAKKGFSSKDEFINDKEKIKMDIVNLESSFATSQDISAVLAFISRRAKENVVDILEVAQSRPKLYKKIAGMKVYSLPIRVKAKAGFHNLCQCLNALQSGFYFLKISSLSIKGNSLYHEVRFVVTALFKE